MNEATVKHEPAKITAHELLNHIFVYGPVTYNDVMEAFNVSRPRASAALMSLRTRNLTRDGARVPGANGRSVKIFEITLKGENRLHYINQHGCSNPWCSCHYDNEQVEGEEVYGYDGEELEEQPG